MFFEWLSNNSSKEANRECLNVREAFNLWDVLKSKYDAVEKLRLWNKFAHDQDLNIILENYDKIFKKNIKILENLLKKYSIRGPEKGRGASNWSGNPEPFRDELIALDTLFYMQEHIENMLQSSRTTTTNDHLRKEVNDMLIKTIKETNSLYKYLKLKGWIDSPPLYPNIPDNIEEKISCAEASHLWDHLTFRYDNKRQNLTYSNLVHDPDFKKILDKGLDILEDQIALLEKECEKFGITLPKRPAEVIEDPESTELFNDDEMYRNIFIGLQGAAILHVKSFKQCTVNDRIRNMFTDMLIKEINFYEKFIKYGKMKGWLNPAPRYRN